jgi:hypothetical protein
VRRALAALACRALAALACRALAALACRALAALACRALAALACLLGCGGPEPGAAPERPWSVQLHVHGPWSEGPGSLDSHGREALGLGVDVLWWSDHDFRITSYRHVTRFGFEGPTEPLDRDEAWSPLTPNEARRHKRVRPISRRCIPESEARFVAGDAAQGERSLRLSARGPGPEFAGCLHSVTADRALATRPLASQVALELDVFAESLGPDARAVVELELSEHALPGLDGYAPLVLRYELAPEGAEPAGRGAVRALPLAIATGRWVHLRLPVSRDAERTFPEVAAGDDSLRQIRVGVESRRGATAAARFDGLRIEQEVAGPAAFDVQREVIERVARARPGLVQLQGVELSYELRHLNVFGAEPLRLDYDALVRESGLLAGDPPRVERARFRRWATRRAVEIAHARGDVVSYNHPFGVTWAGAEPRQSRAEVVRSLAAERVYGADLLEVGYRDRGGHDLADHLGVWDDLAGLGLRPVGIGTSDSHGGTWRGDPNGFVTWIFAASPERAALVEGLRRGRVFFGDPTRFDGSLDLWSASGAVMGQIVVTDRNADEVRIDAAGLVPGDLVDVVVSGAPAARHVAEGERLHVAHPLALAPGEDAFVRAEVRDAEGGPRAFSNPIHFVRPARAEGLPPARVLRESREPAP